MMDETSLKAALQAGSLLPVYIIAGEDIYLKRQALDRIIKATVEEGDDMNLIRFGGGAELQQVYDEVIGFPLMAERKCVVLSEFDLEDAPKTEFDKLCEIVGEAGETCVFVLYFGTYEIDFKKSARFKKLSAAAEAVGGATVRIDHKSVSELTRWLTASAKKKNAILSPRDAAYIIEICSSDISRLDAELTKLCAFVKEGEITREIIDRVCVKSVEASVYDLAEKIIRGDSAGAMELLDELYYMNIKTESIFYNIASAYTDMYRAFAAKKEGKRPEAMGEAFGLGKRAFVLGKAERNLRAFDENKLDLSLAAITGCDKELKSYSSSARISLEKLIVKLIYIMKTGETLD